MRTVRVDDPVAFPGVSYEIEFDLTKPLGIVFDMVYSNGDKTGVRSFVCSCGLACVVVLVGNLFAFRHTQLPSPARSTSHDM